MKKKLKIITTSSASDFEDNMADKIQGDLPKTQPMNKQVPVVNSKEKNQILTTQGNQYERQRELNILENDRILQELGIKNISMKKKIVKQNTHSEKDYKELAKSVAPEKKRTPVYISPFSTNRVGYIKNIRRVIAPNAPQRVPSTLNARKSTVSEIREGNKGGAKRRLALANEDDELFEDMNDMADRESIQEQRDIQMAERESVQEQHDIQMADRESVQEQLQGYEIENETGSIVIPTDTSVTEKEQAVANNAAKMGDKGSFKKGRGHTLKTGIWTMHSSERICVTFDKFGQPVGDESRELGQNLGTIVRISDNVSIGYSEWRKVPMQKKEDMYFLVKSKFAFHPAETSQIKKWIISSMGKKWRTWKGLLKSLYFDSSLTIDEILSQQTDLDDRVDPDQFKELVTRWFTNDFKDTCLKKRSSRSKMREPHVTGTKSFARLSHEMAVKNKGIYPTRGEVYIKTRTRKDGSIVEDAALAVVNSLNAMASDTTSTPVDKDDFANDDCSKVKGPEKSGYVRLVGRMSTTKSNGDSQLIEQLKIASQTINQLQGAFKVAMNIIQEHIPNSNLSTVLSDMNLQVPPIGSGDELDDEARVDKR